MSVFLSPCARSQHVVFNGVSFCGPAELTNCWAPYLSSVIYYIILCYIILYYVILYYIILYYIILYYIILYYIILYDAAVYII
jgi:hypothetical protein